MRVPQAWPVLASALNDQLCLIVTDRKFELLCMNKQIARLRNYAQALVKLLQFFVRNRTRPYLVVGEHVFERSSRQGRPANAFEIEYGRIKSICPCALFNSANRKMLSAADQLLVRILEFVCRSQEGSTEWRPLSS